MRKYLAALVMAAVAVGSMNPSAFAIKEFNDAWSELYTKSDENPELKKRAAEAKCNVCHIQGENKKKHNPYGDEVHKLLEKKNFPKERFKKEPEKVKEEIEAAYKKIEEIKAKDGKTYGEKMKAGELPGGDKDGK